MRRTIAVAAVALAVAVGACGGGGTTDSGVASIDGAQAADKAKGGGKATEQDRERAALAFARCMRQNGVNMPDPGSDGMAVVRPGEGGASAETMRKAEDACKAEREALQGSLGEPPKDVQDKMLAMARCMRSKGINISDPTVGSGGESTVNIIGEEIDDPEFQAAQRECSKEVGMPEPGQPTGAGQ